MGKTSEYSKRPAFSTLTSWSSMSAILGLEIPALGTEYEGGNVTKDAVAKMVDAFQWMIYANNETSVMHWDLVRGCAFT